MNIIELNHRESLCISGGNGWTTAGAWVGGVAAPLVASIIFKGGFSQTTGEVDGYTTLGAIGKIEGVVSAIGVKRLATISACFFVGNIAWSLVADAIKGSNESED